MNHLVAITGFELPVLSQALWWWNKEGVHFSTITIVTTEKGFRALQTGRTDKGSYRPFLGDSGVLAALQRELGITMPKVRFEILESPDGIAEDGNIEAETVDAAAMKILKVIQSFTRSDERIYCMYAGGRRAMVAQLVSTLVVAGDPKRFSLHYIKKNNDLPDAEHFYYPPSDLGCPVPLEVFTIPVPMLGPIYGDAIRDKTNYREVMKSTQAYINHSAVAPITYNLNPGDPTIITSNPSMQNTLAEITECACSGVSPVILDGPTGTGKDLAAALYCYQYKKHHNGEAKYLTANLAAIPESLQVSTLFGYKKGAFSGAVNDTPGFLEKAHNGVIFLDELNSSTLELQAALLRFLEKGEIQPVGGNDEVKTVDVKIIFAINERIGDLVNEKRVRRDFFHRAKRIVPIPSLSERREDIPLLIEHFLAEYAKTHTCPQKHFTEEAMEYLQARQWNGNVRELKNFVERKAGHAGDGPRPLEIELEYVDKVNDSLVRDDMRMQLESLIGNWVSQSTASNDGDLLCSIEDITYRHLFERFNGNASQAYRASGIPEKTIANNWKKRELLR